jgi:ABC-type nitrate/sulfonate/bicarbonate transport system permease component
MPDFISRKLLLQIAYPVLALILVIALWAFLVDIFDIPRYVMPSPMQVWDHLVSDWPAMAKGFGVTFLEFLLGFLCGAGAGFIFAVLMDSSVPVRGVLYPVLIASQAIPVVAISAALTIWLGFGLAPKLVIVALVVFFPVVVNVLDGLASVDRDLLNLVRAMGASKFSIFRHVKLPATYAPLFSALKLSATFSVTGAVIAEWTASTSGGIGAYLLQANSRLNTAGTFAAISVLALLGIVSFLLVVLAEYSLTPWKSSSKARTWSRTYWRDPAPAAADTRTLPQS